MENQHQKIKGYRDLTQAEIDLMNEIKAKGEELGALVDKVNKELLAQSHNRNDNYFDHMRWAAIARTDFQTGLMALTRAIAQPTSF
jgi:hypothetical protein